MLLSHRTTLFIFYFKMFFCLKIIIWGLKGTMINYVEQNYDINEVKFIGLGIFGAVLNLFFFRVEGKLIKLASISVLVLLLGGFFLFIFPVFRIITDNNLCPHFSTADYCQQFRTFLICFTLFDNVGIFCVLSILKYSTKFADIKKKVREEPTSGKKEESKSPAGPFAPLDEDQDDEPEKMETDPKE